MRIIQHLSDVYPQSIKPICILCHRYLSLIHHSLKLLNLINAAVHFETSENKKGPPHLEILLHII